MHDIIIKIIDGRLPSTKVTKRLVKHKLAMVGLTIIIILIFLAIFAQFIAPNDPIQQNLRYRLTAPFENSDFPFGTDNHGRCVLSRILHGTQISLSTGIVIVIMTATIGILIGVISGYYGGLIDNFCMRIVDILIAFPGIILALVIAGLLGPSLFNVMLALGIQGWTGYARVVRGSVLSVKEKDFVEAAISIGASDTKIMFKHILPNCLAPVIVMATLGVAHIILAASALSFLGLGMQPPYPEWGSMLNAGRPFMLTAPYLTIIPGIAIMISVLAFNFLGDGLRDAFDPKNREL